MTRPERRKRMGEERSEKDVAERERRKGRKKGKNQKWFGLAWFGVVCPSLRLAGCGRQCCVILPGDTRYRTLLIETSARSQSDGSTETAGPYYILVPYVTPAKLLWA
jgi:hypothetical protein